MGNGTVVGEACTALTILLRSYCFVSIFLYAKTIRTHCVLYKTHYRRRPRAMHRRPLTFLGLLVEECIIKYFALFCIILHCLAQNGSQIGPKSCQIHQKSIQNYAKSIQNEVLEPFWEELAPKSAQRRAPEAQK